MASCWILRKVFFFFQLLKSSYLGHTFFVNIIYCPSQIEVCKPKPRSACNIVADDDFSATTYCKLTIYIKNNCGWPPFYSNLNIQYKENLQVLKIHFALQVNLLIFFNEFIFVLTFKYKI